MKYYGFVTFFLVSYLVILYYFSRARAQVEPVDGFSRFMARTTCFRLRTALLELRQYRNSFGGNIPEKLPQRGREMNRLFQAKRAEYKNRDILQKINTIHVQF